VNDTDKVGAANLLWVLEQPAWFFLVREEGSLKAADQSPLEVGTLTWTEDR
jgi:hypothetical protein